MGIQWPLVLFTLLTGLGVSAFSCVAVTELLGVAGSIRLQGAITALVAVAVGGGFSLLHLSHPLRAYHIARHLGTGVGKEMALIGLTGGFVFLYVIMLGTGFSGPATKVVASLGLISSLLMAFEMGAIYILPARPAWNTWLWPFIYVASAAVNGLFVMAIWGAVFEDRVGPAVVTGITRATLISLVVFGGSILAYIIFLDKASYRAAQRSPTRLLAGDLATLFWAGVVLAGLAIPMGATFCMQALKEAHSSLTAGIIGLVAALIGGITIRALMYRLGSEADPILE